MKILFDHQALVLQTHGGVSRCFAELYKHLPSGCQAEISLLESDNAYLKGMGIGKPAGYNYRHFIFPFHWPYKAKMFTAYNRLIGRGRNYSNKFIYNRTETVRLLKKGKFDIFHPTFFDDYFLPYLNGKPFVLTIHDMIPELYPQYFPLDDFQIVKKRKLAPLASAIIAVSENTKRDVVRLLNVPEEKVHVIYHGCSFPTAEGGGNLFDYPYILYVGERGGYKNFLSFANNIAFVLDRHKDLQVVCTGRPFNDEELRLLEKLRLHNRFVHRWVKEDAEMFALYHHAVCFVYPSEYEGFGIPILEAYQAGCPVMLNRTSCFPEIAGDAAIYFEMTPTGSDFPQQFEHLYTMSDADRETLLAKQRNRLSRYSWDKAAQQLADIYQSLV